MNSIARSATVVGLLGFQDRVLISDVHVAAGIEDYSALSAVFWDLYPVLRSNDVPLPRSATQALEHCRQVQAELMQLLESMGMLKQPGSPSNIGWLERILQFGYRLTQKKALQRAGKNYRDSVFLLRDVVMDAVTHYHLQHMRHELDHLCGNQDKENIEITLPNKAVATAKPKRAWTTSGMAEFHDPNDPCHDEWVEAKKEDLCFTAFAYIPMSRDANDSSSLSNIDKTARIIRLKGLYDTGSDRNLISLTFLQKHGIDKTPLVRALPHPEMIEGVEKEMVTAVGQVAEIKWCMDGSDPQTNIFSVVDTNNDSYDILLGWPFIIKEGKVAFRKKRAPDRVRFLGLSPGREKRMRETTADNQNRIRQQIEGDRANAAKRSDLRRAQARNARMCDDAAQSRSAPVDLGLWSGSTGATTAIGSPTSAGDDSQYGTSPPSQFSTAPTTPGLPPPGLGISDHPTPGAVKRDF